MTSRARRLLDRPGRRWLLGLAASVAGLVLDRRWYRTRWTGREWSYRIGQDRILSNQLLRPEHTFVADLEIFLWDFDPSRGDIVLDIGAGTGTEAIPLARMVGPTGRVIAVEAHPATAEILARAVQGDGVSNVVVVQAAVADAPGTLAISDLDEAGTNTVLDGGSIVVPAITVDQLVHDHDLDRVALLKMNIEGAERLALRGMEATIERVDRVVISCHDFLGTTWGATREEVRGWLEAHGFAVTDRPDDPRPWCRDTLYGRRIGGPAPTPPTHVGG